MNKYTPDYLIKKVFVQTRHLVYEWERGEKISGSQSRSLDHVLYIFSVEEPLISFHLS